MTPSARLAWPADAAAIARIQRSSSADDAAVELAFGPLAEHVARWTATLTRSPDARFRVLVATDDSDAVVAYGVVHPGADPDVDPMSHGELAELVVDGSVRRTGHGSRLLHAVVDTAAADGFTVLRTWTASTDDATRSLLVASGWATDGAHRELESADGRRLKQVRLHTSIGGAGA